MNKIINNKIKTYFLVFTFFFLSGFSVLLLPPPGLNNAAPIGAFLNGNFPDQLSTGNVPYEPVFPNITFDSPLTFNEIPAGNRIIVGQRDGKIYWFNKTASVSNKNLMLDLSGKVGVVWDGGFLGLTLHPRFGTSGYNYMYTYYSTKDSNGGNEPTSPKPQGCDAEQSFGNYLVLARYTVNPNTLAVSADSEQILIKVRMYNSTHRGGGLLFGDDSFLYLTTGDQAAFNKAQDFTNNLDGGVLRLDVDKDPAKSHPPVRTMPQDHGFSDEISGNDYWIPNDNPFLSPGGQNFEEYYSIGHRNPHRMTKDRLTGKLYVGEIGGGQREEINIIEKGKNYGWPIHEGFVLFTNCLNTLVNNMPHETPLTDFPRAEANAIIGGYVYRGEEVPELYGRYICADWGNGEEIWSVDINTGSYEQIGNFASAEIISFGEDNQGEIYILKQEVSTLFKMRATTTTTENFPRFLSQTGAFTNLQNLTPRAGLIPYDLVESFWSDGAIKRRWLAIPNDGNPNTAAEQIQFSENGDWQFPTGTVLVKHFELPINENNPSITKRLETRFSVKASNGQFYFLTYKWNNAGTDAELLETGLEENISITQAGGGQRIQTWNYPSRTECKTCHNNASGGTLGLRTRNLNKDFTYPTTGITGNQLVTLSHIGLLNQTISDSDASSFLTHKSINDPTASLEEKARSYLDLNCAYCHRPGTGNRADFDLSLDLNTQQTGLLAAQFNQSIGVSNEQILSAGNPLSSILYHRINSTDTNIQMPPLAKNRIDDEGVQLISDWISQLGNSNSDNGLDATYYNNIDFTGSTITRTDPVIDFLWGQGSPDPAIGSDTYSARWEGFVEATTSGTYTFFTRTDDGVRLWVNNQLIIDKWINQGPTEWSGTIIMTAGQKIPIKMEYYENGGGAVAQLSWQGPGVSKQIIPATNLSSNGGGGINCTTTQNVALGKSATQSSNYNGTFTPSKANDNDNNSFNHTQNDTNAWWEIDLGGVYDIKTIKVVNRKSCCQDRLSDFYVLVSDVPFNSKNLSNTLNQSGVSDYFFSGPTGNRRKFDVNHTGRYVRVQLEGTNYLHVAEVKVNGCTNSSPKLDQETTIANLVYPNPTSDKLFLDLDSYYTDKNLDYAIMNVQGQLVETGTFGSVYTDQVELDVSSSKFPAGTYFLSLTTGDARQVIKFVVMK